MDENKTTFGEIPPTRSSLGLAIRRRLASPPLLGASQREPLGSLSNPSVGSLRHPSVGSLRHPSVGSLSNPLEV
eukprot:5843857-Pyramimonas_sp.AAC.2